MNLYRNPSLVPSVQCIKTGNECYPGYYYGVFSRISLGVLLSKITVNLQNESLSVSNNDSLCAKVADQCDCACM